MKKKKHIKFKERIKVKFKLNRMTQMQQNIFSVYIRLFHTTLPDESSVLFSLKYQYIIVLTEYYILIIL